MVGVVMREGQALHAGHLRKLHGLIEAAVSPSAPVLQFLSGELCIMDQQVGAARQFHQPRIVPDDFVPPKPGVFVKETMNALADLGEKMGADPSTWSTSPP